jgi:hypothetical protein
LTAKCDGVGEEERRRGGLIPDSRTGILQLRATVEEKRRVNTEFGDRDLTVTRLTKEKRSKKPTKSHIY